MRAIKDCTVLVGGWVLPLWKIWVRQLELLFPTYGKILNIPNHQPGRRYFRCTWTQITIDQEVKRRGIKPTWYDSHDISHLFWWLKQQHKSLFSGFSSTIDNRHIYTYLLKKVASSIGLAAVTGSWLLEKNDILDPTWEAADGGRCHTPWSQMASASSSNVAIQVTCSCGPTNSYNWDYFMIYNLSYRSYKL